jgi:hypothetical protein
MDALTQEAIDRFLQAIVLKLSVENACKAAGVSKTTVYRWLRKGREQRAIKEGLAEAEQVEFGESHSVYLDFLERFEKARLQMEARAATEVLKGIEGNPRLALSVLGRISPQTWGRKDIRQNLVFVNLQEAGLVQRDGRIDERDVDRFLEELDQDDLERELLEENTTQGSTEGEEAPLIQQE